MRLPSGATSLSPSFNLLLRVYGSLRASAPLRSLQPLPLLGLPQSRAGTRHSRAAPLVARAVAVVHRRGIAGPLQALGQLLGDHDAAVASARTADSDRQVRLALLLVPG